MSDFGFTAVPASAAALRPSNEQPKSVPAEQLQPPATPLSARILEYAQSKLSADTFRHSMRVYAYGLAIARECFPEWELQGALQETWFCTAMLHDIGTTDENMATSKLSYEFLAGFIALEVMQEGGATGSVSSAPRTQAESVAEAILRHQDVQDKGMVSLMTQLIQLGTLLDNIGAEVPSRWVTADTIDNVNRAWPRHGWSGCFSSTVAKEKQLKPYAMVTRIDGFENLIMDNARTAQGKGN